MPDNLTGAADGEATLATCDCLYEPSRALTNGSRSAVVTPPLPFISLAQTGWLAGPPLIKAETNAWMSAPFRRPSPLVSPPPRVKTDRTAALLVAFPQVFVTTTV